MNFQIEEWVDETRIKIILGWANLVQISKIVC